MTSPVTRQLSDVVCMGCGCLCDDLQVQFSDDHLVNAEHACPQGLTWAERTNFPMPATLANVRGQSVDVTQAIAAATEILSQSQAPLIYGLSCSETAAQRAAIALGDRLGAIVDTLTSVGRASSIMAQQVAGMVTCSLGETRQRADLIVYWRADPVASHPRFLERYAADPTSEFLPQGREDRRVIVIDNQQNETAADHADEVIPLRTGADLTFLTYLRLLLKFPDRQVPDIAGLTPAELAAGRRLVQQLSTCRYGCIFFDLGSMEAIESSASRVSERLTTEALIRFTIDLNAQTRMSLRSLSRTFRCKGQAEQHSLSRTFMCKGEAEQHSLRQQGGFPGADNVLSWQTGYPFGVDFSRGYPRYNPGEFTAQELLERGEVDACLLVGHDDLSRLSKHARETLQRIPTICLHEPDAASLDAEVSIVVGIPGIHVSGTIDRLDEIPLPLRAISPGSSYPSAADILTSMLNALEPVETPIED